MIINRHCYLLNKSSRQIFERSVQRHERPRNPASKTPDRKEKSGGVEKEITTTLLERKTNTTAEN
jgi:hypothetical protein